MKLKSSDEIYILKQVDHHLKGGKKTGCYMQDLDLILSLLTYAAHYIPLSSVYILFIDLIGSFFHFVVVFQAQNYSKINSLSRKVRTNLAVNMFLILILSYSH